MLLQGIVLRMYIKMIKFTVMIGALLELTLAMLIPKRSLIGPIEALLKMEHKDFISKKVVTGEFMGNIDMSVHIKHPHKIIKGSLTTLQEVELHMVSLMEMDPTIILAVDIMVILVPRWWQWWCSRLSVWRRSLKFIIFWSKNEGIDKIDRLFKICLNKTC